jgi:hypothetical protein
VLVDLNRCSVFEHNAFIHRSSSSVERDRASRDESFDVLSHLNFHARDTVLGRDPYSVVDSITYYVLR